VRENSLQSAGVQRNGFPSVDPFLLLAQRGPNRFLETGAGKGVAGFSSFPVDASRAQGAQRSTTSISAPPRSLHQLIQEI
jgi:hypothetical protein